MLRHLHLPADFLRDVRPGGKTSLGSRGGFLERTKFVMSHLQPGLQRWCDAPVVGCRILDLISLARLEGAD